MKNKFYLQMFAEDTAESAKMGEDGSKTGGEGKSSTEEKKTENKPKYSDEEVNAILDKKFAEWQKKQNKAVEEAEKLGRMNAQQKAEYERDQLQKELDALKKKDTLAEMTKTARKMLTDEGINVTDDLLSVMVTTDAAETKSAIDGFTKAFKAAVESAVKEKLKGNPPTKGTGGSGSATMTKEQIMAIKDPEQRQKMMLENKHLFNF